MGGRRRIWIVVLLGLVLAIATGCADASRHAPARRASAPESAHWIASWIASPEAPGPGDPLGGGFRDQTIRNFIYTSAGGTLARVRFDNSFGTRGLSIGAAAIGVASRGSGDAGYGVLPGTNLLLTFAGRGWTVIPPGGQALSDPIRMTVQPHELLAVSLFLPQATGPPTQHTDSHEVNLVAAGNHVLATRAAGYWRPVDSWYFVSGVDVGGSTGTRGALIAFGDSITNGDGSRTGAEARWPNDLQRRLDRRSGPALSILDAGIDGNRVLNPTACCGPSALTRFGHDVLEQAGVREVILLEGINDIGYGSSPSPLASPRVQVSAQQVISGYEQLITSAHAAGLKIYGATLTPFHGSQHWTPAREAEREAINAWILHSGAFDGVIDFAAALADPRDPKRLDPNYDWGDHLHPNDAGYQAMANAVNLAMLMRGL